MLAEIYFAGEQHMEFRSDSMHVCPSLCTDELRYTVLKTGRDTSMKCNSKEY